MSKNDMLLELIARCEDACRGAFERIEDVALHNQRKVLEAFRKNFVSDRHLKGSTGYGYDDIGRDTLARVYSDVFCTDSAIVSPNITSGTQALTVALFGLLRPNDTLLSVSGKPYDTLHKVISGENIGSLKDYNIQYGEIALLDDDFDYETIAKYISNIVPKVVLVTRSRGYSWRNALSAKSIGKLTEFIKNISKNIIIMVDNCYGEFVESAEPTQAGVDIAVGSLIKNIGGGLAPSGGYIVGKEEYIEQISYRLTAPSIGREVGSYYGGYHYHYQGLFLAPHIVMNALKGSILFGKVFTELGYKTFPPYDSECYDIIRSIKFDTKEELILFCKMIQEISPIDSHVSPEPWDMPGYSEQVIMAAGTFVQGASIELSADAPIKAPYIAYLQGGLTYEHAKLAVEHCARALISYRN